MMKSQYEIQIPYKQQYEQQSSEPELRTPEDKHRYAMFVKGNDFNKGGRTFIFRDELGQYVSTFVSQYSPIIEKNLEPGVKDAVLALHQKGYLTFTSCQGHDDSKHRYIGIVFNTLEQKKEFMFQMNMLKCDIYWYDNVINSVERPWKDVPWWSDAIKLHIIYDDDSFAKSTVVDRRDKPYTDEELTKFWNIQMCREYEHYEAVIFTFGYPMVEKNLFQKLKKLFFYNKYKVEASYNDFLNKVNKLDK